MYIVYAIADKGEGRVQEIGRFEQGDGFEIQSGIIARDAVISIEWERDEDEVENLGA